MRFPEPKQATLFDPAEYGIEPATPPAGVEDPQFYAAAKAWAETGRSPRAQDERLACVIRAFEAGTPTMLNWLRGIIRESDKGDRERDSRRRAKRDSNRATRAVGPDGPAGVRDRRRGAGGTDHVPAGDGEKGQAGRDVLRGIGDPRVPGERRPVATVAGAPAVERAEETGCGGAEVRDEGAGGPDQRCPQCSQLLDRYGRCTKCLDWMCRCGKMTQSFLISACPACTKATDDAAAERAQALRAWQLRKAKR